MGISDSADIEPPIGPLTTHSLNPAIIWTENTHNRRGGVAWGSGRPLAGWLPPKPRFLRRYQPDQVLGCGLNPAGARPAREAGCPRRPRENRAGAVHEPPVSYRPRLVWVAHSHCYG